jgi:hypothetical protein
MSALIADATPLMNAAGTSAALTAIAAGAAYDLRQMCRTFTFMKTTIQGGGFAALSITFEGSLDGINWYTLGTDATTANGVTFVMDKPSRYVRANVTAFTGGTSASVLVGACL